MKRGQRHLVTCKCFLPQFKKRESPPSHKFVVFSVIGEDDVVEVKYAQCNNCGSIHKVIDVCMSEILIGKDEMHSIMTIDDIKTSLPKSLVDILERHTLDVSSWEQAAFIIENKEWGNYVVLTQDGDEGTRQGKYVRILSETFFKIDSFVRDDIAIPGE
jgi:hypothetical protein